MSNTTDIATSIIQQAGNEFIIYLQSCNIGLCEWLPTASVYISEISLGYAYYAFVFFYLFFVKITTGGQILFLLATCSYVNLFFKMLWSQPRPYWVNTAVKAIECRDSTFGAPSGHLSPPFLVFFFLIYSYYRENRRQQRELIEKLNKGEFGNANREEALRRIQKNKRNTVICCIALTMITIFWLVSIAFSRMYVGVHFPHDLAIGLLIAIVATVFYVFFFVSSLKKRLLDFLEIERAEEIFQHNYEWLFGIKIPDYVETARGRQTYISQLLGLAEGTIQKKENTSTEVRSFYAKNAKLLWTILIAFIISLLLTFASLGVSYFSLITADLTQWRQLAQLQCTEEIFDPQTNSFINIIQLCAAFFSLASTMLFLAKMGLDVYPTETLRKKILRAVLLSVVFVTVFGTLFYFILQRSYELARIFYFTNYWIIAGVCIMNYAVTVIVCSVVLLLPIIPIDKAGFIELRNKITKSLRE